MKLLMILSRVPYPLEKGDKLRAYHQLRCLSQKHEVHLFCLNDTSLHPDAISILSQFCKSIRIEKINKLQIAWNAFKSIFNGKPFQVSYFHNCKAQKKLNKYIQEIKPEHIYCQLIRTAEYVKEQNLSKTIDFQDTFSVSYQLRSEKSRGFKKLFLSWEARRVKKYESEIYRSFDQHTLISENDRELFPHPERRNIKIIKNGVDFDFFKPQMLEKKYDLVFIGNMSYLPNIDAAVFLCKSIVPIVLRKQKIKVLIAGANPHPQVQALANEWVDVCGWVEDIRKCYAVSQIFVAPMRIGTGLQNKLLEAMAMQLPCITSPLANLALEAEHHKEILIAETKEEFANAILELLNNPQIHHDIAQTGYRYIQQNFSWERETEKIFTRNQ